MDIASRVSLVRDLLEAALKGENSVSKRNDIVIRALAMMNVTARELREAIDREYNH